MLAIGGDGGVGGGGGFGSVSNESDPAISLKVFKKSERVRWSDPAELVASVRVYRGIVRAAVDLNEYNILSESLTNFGFQLTYYLL